MTDISPLPPKYLIIIQQWIADGLTVAEMTEKLAKEYDLVVPQYSVQSQAKKVRQAYQEQLKAQLVAGLGATVASDIAIMEDVVNKLYNSFNVSMAAGDTMQAVKTAGELKKWVGDRVRMSGIDRPDQKEDHSEAKGEVIAQLQSTINKKSN
jgi:hypothetical protein